MTRYVVYRDRIINKNLNAAKEHIKWCRRNLGERGTDWDFSGSINLDIVIYTEKYATFYILKFG